jgi:hypothetical protein
MRVIICGSRDWDDELTIYTYLMGLRAASYRTTLTVIHGDCRGADRIADAAARQLGINVEAHPADWRGQGRSAGFKRNRLMLDLGADRVAAFKDYFDHTMQTGGTENMISLARMARIETLVVSHH